MAVTLTQMGADKQEIEYVEGMTVQELLDAAGVEASDESTITLNGESADLGTAVPDDAQVVLTPKIRNG